MDAPTTDTAGHEGQDGCDAVTGPRGAEADALMRTLRKMPYHIDISGYLALRAALIFGQTMAKLVGDDRDPELIAGLRKLVEARDCFVRAIGADHMTVAAYMYDAKPHPEFGFSHALEELRAGNRVARRAWNKYDRRWLIRIPGSAGTVDADKPIGVSVPGLVGQELRYDPHIDVCAFHNAVAHLAPWVPAQGDLLADDWYVVGDDGV